MKSSARYLATDNPIWGFAVGLLVASLTHQNITEDSLITIAGIIAGVSATLLGFIIAAITILMTLDNRPFIQKIKATGHYQKLIKNMQLTATLLLLTTVLAIAVTLTPMAMRGISMSILVCAVVTTFYTFTVATSRLWKVMDIVSTSR